jgi:hypothetical protein
VLLRTYDGKAQTVFLHGIGGIAFLGVDDPGACAEHDTRSDFVFVRVGTENAFSCGDIVNFPVFVTVSRGAPGFDGIGVGGKVQDDREFVDLESAAADIVTVSYHVFGY